MATETITIRVQTEEKQFIKEMAEFLGLSVTDVLMNYTIEDLEDIYDVRAGEEAHKEFIESGEVTYTLEEAAKYLGVEL